jgi:hypothetical protein
MVVTYRITKKLSGVLDGIEVTDTLTQDAMLPPPFQAGEVVGVSSGINALERAIQWRREMALVERVIQSLFPDVI